jgi:uncharacterized protein YfaP (DUF2135 family)
MNKPPRSFLLVISSGRRSTTTRAFLTAIACACLWVGCGESPTTDPSPIDPETILREELARQGLSPSWFPGCIWQTFRLRLPSYRGRSLEFILADIRAIIAGCRQTNEATTCPAAVNQDIVELFPTENNLRQDAVTECGRIYQDFENGDEIAAAERAFQFFGTTLERNENGELLDPAPSAEQRIADIFAAIFDDLGLDFPALDPDVLASGEYAVGTLTPNGPPLITESKHAGIDDGGGLLGPVSVIIAQIPAESGGLEASSVSHPCPAGIDDSFDCYPQFFDYTVVPASNVNPAVGLKVGQCNVSPSGVEVLLLTPEGFLLEDDAPTGVVCGNVEAEEVTMTGWRSYAWAVLEPISPLFRVTPAIAGKNPIGGRISAFSPVAPADPTSGGDPSVTIISPVDGTETSNATVFLEGSVSDPTATATATISGATDFEIPLTLGAGGEFSQEIPLQVGTSTITVTAVDDNENVGESSVDVTRTGSAEELTITLTWDTASDMDLHLLRGAETPFFDSLDDCFYGNCVSSSPDWGPTGSVGDPSLDIDDTGGFGPENIRLDQVETDLIYRVGVDAFSGVPTQNRVGVTFQGATIECGPVLLQSGTVDDMLVVAIIDAQPGGDGAFCTDLESSMARALRPTSITNPITKPR